MADPVIIRRAGHQEIDVLDAADIPALPYDASGAAATAASGAASALTAHEADTTAVHGIADTANLYAAGGTDVAVADGGTGAGTAAAARTALGLVIGTDVRAQGSGDPTLASLGAAAAISAGRTNLGGTIGYQFPGTTIGATLSTMALSINTLEYAFLLLPTPMTIDQCGFVVTTGPASAANVRVGIYAATTDWQPTGSALFDVGVAVAQSFTGIKAAVGTVALPAGRYLTAINCDVAMTVRVWRGFLVAGGFVDSLMASAHSGGTVASTYGAMPAPGTAYTTARSAGDHHVALRVLVP